MTLSYDKFGVYGDFMSEFNKKWEPIPLKTGSVDESNAKELVFGRKEFVKLFWKKIASGASLYILAERNMGKTWALWLAIADKPEKANPAFFDAEKVNSVEEFVWKLNQELHQKGHVSNKSAKKVGDWFRRIFQLVQGQKIHDIEVPALDPWGTFLEDTIHDFIEMSGDKTPVLIIDELPFLIDKIYKNQGPQKASELLDKLRAIDQTLTTFKMVFCGSLGMHIVLEKLKESGYTGRPINTMEPLEVPPLGSEGALKLSAGLLLSEKIPCVNLEETAKAIARISSGVPYYIKQIISWLSDHPGEDMTPETVEHTLKQMFDAPGDPAEFQYYDGRLDQYYPEDIQEKARAALDVLSQKSEGLHFNDLLNLVRHRPNTLLVDPESLLNVLRILKDDHYLESRSSHWKYKLEIVRLWWYEHRGGLEL